MIGTGITRTYPAAHRGLQADIAAQGLVLSQFWPDAPPTKQSFPMRNAVMSGYGFASVVVEAGEHSGARIQARLAVEHGRPVVLLADVVRATTWGRALQGQPGVHIAADAVEALGMVEQIGQQPDHTQQLLDSLALSGS